MEPTSPTAPPWPHCAHSTDPATGPLGCRGIRVPGHSACLAHLADADRDAYLAGLAPGTSIDYRSTTFTRSLLRALLNALRDPASGNPRLGDAVFWSATFEDDAGFESATFNCDSTFKSATFERDAEFASATFNGDAGFESATFKEAASVGPLVCAGRVLLSGAVFESPVPLSIAAGRLECRRTRWSSTAEIRLRYATVDFARAVFEYPLTIAAEPDPFVLTNGQQIAEEPLASAPAPAVRVASLRGVAAAHLVLADLDLSACLLAGQRHAERRTQRPPRRRPSSCRATSPPEARQGRHRGRCRP